MQSKSELACGSASAAERLEAEARYAAAAAAAAASGAPAPFRGPAADSALGERLIDAIGIVAAVGYACEASPLIPLCGITYRRGDKGATNDMLARSLELQCGASAPRAVRREDFVVDPATPFRVTIRGTTQLMRATITNDLPRVLRLIHLGAPLDLADGSRGLSALHWACKCGHARIAEALLDGTGSGSSGAPINLQSPKFGATPLGLASQHGHADIVHMLLARGARQELQTRDGHTALHCAVIFEHFDIVEQLCSASGAIFALEAKRRFDGRTPRDVAVFRSRWSQNHERLIIILDEHERRLKAV